MKDLIEQKLDRYIVHTPLDEERALREILQEIILYALYRADFFEAAAFQGGTALRILYGLNRFSEDLGFALKNDDSGFDLGTYMTRVIEAASAFDLILEIAGREKAGKAMQNRFLKHHSLGGMLELRFRHDDRKKINIKIEVDTHPPAGASYEQVFHDFPLDFSLSAFDRPSLFAGKLHALLCRSAPKGRDWYDFAWYISQDVTVNRTLLTNAIDQSGPWKGKAQKVTDKWLKTAMTNRCKELDWSAIREDVRPLLGAEEQDQLKHWSAALFVQKLNRLKLSETLSSR